MSSRRNIGALIVCTAVVSAAAGAAVAGAIITHRRQRRNARRADDDDDDDDEQSEKPDGGQAPVESVLQGQREVAARREKGLDPSCVESSSADLRQLPPQAPQHSYEVLVQLNDVEAQQLSLPPPPPVTSLSRSASENRPRIVRRSSIRGMVESDGNGGGTNADGAGGRRRRMARRVSFSDAAAAAPSICTTDFVSSLDEQVSQRKRILKERSGSFDSSVTSSSFSSFGDTVHNGTNPSLPLHSESGNRRESTTTVEIGEEENNFTKDAAVRDLEEFESAVVSKITDLNESLTLLRRTRTVAKMSHRLMAAPDETACFEEVTKLFVPLFGVDRCSYSLLVDTNHFTVRKVTVHRRDHASNLGVDFEQSDVRVPLKGSAIGHCAKTLEPLYTPCTNESPFKLHRKIYEMGLNTVLTTPILVNGNKFAGCLNLGLVKEDALTKHDQLLVKDIAAVLGSSIYAKRMQRAMEASNRISQELLHSFIPPKVLEKIECYWDVESEEYQSLSRRSSRGSLASSRRSSASSLGGNDDADDDRGIEDVDAEGNNVRSARWHEIKGQLKFVNGIEAVGAENIGVTVDTSAIDLDQSFHGVSQALYAEDVESVCIIFTDIVGFSKISLDLAPIHVMDMVQALFSRFDEICDLYGVLKLETIGDAYLCSTGLMEDDDGAKDDGGRDAAIRALDMARDMVLAAQEVRVPRGKRDSNDEGETLQIRVGVHVGPITAGVLGHRMPKFCCFGTAVNMAARMEQTSLPGKIRVTEDFHDLVGDYENGWEDSETIEVKNMGDVVTYLLNPAV